MDNKIYSPPKSELGPEGVSSLNESIGVYNGGYSAPMKKAAITLIALQILLSSVGLFQSEGFDPVNIFLSFCFTVSHIVFFVYLVAKVRGIKIRNNAPSEVGALGIWGYIWRLWIVQYGALVISGVTFSFSGISNGIQSPSLALTTMFGISTFPVGLVLVWLLFSRNRKEQFNWFIAIFRGY